MNLNAKTYAYVLPETSISADYDYYTYLQAITLEISESTYAFLAKCVLSVGSLSQVTKWDPMAKFPPGAVILSNVTVLSYFPDNPVSTYVFVVASYRLTGSATFSINCAFRSNFL